MWYPTVTRRQNGPLWEDMLSLRRNVDQLLAGLFDDSAGYGMGGWMPRMDVLDHAEAVQVTADLPGFESDDIDVTVENGVLTISGERHASQEPNDEADYRLRERTFGRFERSFTLPSGVDADRISAEYVNGVLTISLPKVESAKPRRVKIQQKKNGWRERITAGKSA